MLPPEGEEEMLPPEGEEEMLPPEDEMAPEEEKDIDLTPEEAQVIVDLADRIKDEMPELEGEEDEMLPPEGEEEMLPPEGTEGEMPEEELLPPEAMAESFMRTLQHRVQNRIQREQAKARFINEVTQQVAANLGPRRGVSQEQLINEVMRRVALRLRQGR
jgi:hypothetical protein